MEERNEVDITVLDTEETVNNLINTKANETNDVKTALDLMFTHDALKNKETFEFAREEKRVELKNDAEARRIQSETERISKEVEKVKQEKQKQLAELDKIISSKQKEVEELKVESDKAQAFFENNEDILSCVGVRSKKTLKVMYWLMIPALVIFLFIQFIALPITIGGKIIEMIVEIVGNICGAVANHAVKIMLTILIIVLLIGGGIAVYYYGGKLIL